MKSLIVKTSSLALLSTAWSLAALAQTTSTSVATPTNTSVANISSGSSQSFKLPVDLSYTGWFYGPDLATPTAANTATDSFTDLSDTKAQDPLSARHYLTVAKSLNKNFTLSGTLDFRTVFTDPGSSNARGFYWKDCFVKLGHSGLAEMNLSGNSIKLVGDVRYYAPTSKGARDNNTVGAFRLSLNPSIQFGKSIFSISTVNYVKGWAQTRGTTPITHDADGNVTKDGGSLPLLELYTGPQINAQFTSSINGFILYEAIATKYNNTRAGNINWTSDNAAGSFVTDVEPGIEFAVTKNIAITPYLNWYPALPITHSSMNLQLSASL